VGWPFSVTFSDVKEFFLGFDVKEQNIEFIR
jgi:hypothetical protein